MFSERLVETERGIQEFGEDNDGDDDEDDQMRFESNFRRSDQNCPEMSTQRSILSKY